MGISIWLIRGTPFFLTPCLFVRPLTHNPLASSLDRAASSIDRRVCARGGMAPCFPSLFLLRACRQGFGMRWDSSISLSQTSLSLPALLSQCCQLRDTSKYAASKHSHLTTQFNGPPFYSDPCLQFVR
jgi:hypothetical protein